MIRDRSTFDAITLEPGASYRVWLVGERYPVEKATFVEARLSAANGETEYFFDARWTFAALSSEILAVERVR